MKEQRYKNSSKLNWILVVFQVIIAIASLFVAFYFYNENLRILQLSKRADLSILVNKANCIVTTPSFTFEISAEIRNEGSRSTTIKNVEIWLLFKPFSWTHTIIRKYASDFGWENLTILEEQTKQLSMSIVVPCYKPYENSSTYVTPDDGWIQIEHYDGKGYQEQKEEFTTIYRLA